MTCSITWSVGRSQGQPFATLFCRRCMAPIRHRLTPGAARELREELIKQGHLCRRQHALPVPVPAQVAAHD
ncbi:hypothetical protein SAMN04487957_11088 [Halomonas shengliensis]|uniref:Uncharacterized protein n=1 Tax=Halomonas shengliensis TaxID=419597 RepID=A0A1H0LSA4_9GAMM|nr:hypothetical protein [Halomonas shengliensis]SDO71112.1 hypothetical protein SAMN04487957_11088 [Halomonas shengliensis]